MALLTQDGNGLLCSTDGANATATAAATAAAAASTTRTTLFANGLVLGVGGAAQTKQIGSPNIALKRMFVAVGRTHSIRKRLLDGFSECSVIRGSRLTNHLRDT